MKIYWETYYSGYQSPDGHYHFKGIEVKFNMMWLVWAIIMSLSILFTGFALFKPTDMISLKIFSYGIGLFLFIISFVCVEIGEDDAMLRGVIDIYLKTPKEKTKVENWKDELT